MHDPVNRPVAQLLAGVTMLLLAVIALVKGAWALIHHMPVYFRGPQSPWQAVVGGGICFAIGIYIVHNAIRKRKKT